jgi:DNA topoisomerase-1
MPAMPDRRGWARVGSRRRFRYVDAEGRRITDEASLKRIEGLAIPPAWRDVWISARPAAKLQATGVDSAGRTQYLYHPLFVQQQEQLKWERLIRFGERLPLLRRRIEAHLDLPELSVERVCAAAACLLCEAWLRVGSDQHTRRSHTFGITTLTKRHAKVTGRRVRFAFRGKNGTPVRATVLHPRLAATISSLLELPGGARLFRYSDGNGSCNVTGSVLNEYLKEDLGEEFSAKDFRTWGGTLTAAQHLADAGPAAGQREAEEAVAAAMRAAGRTLRNTASVARTSYVSPAVVEQYRNGRTLADFWPQRDGRPAARNGLAPEERALLGLLRSHRLTSRRSKRAD